MISLHRFFPLFFLFLFSCESFNPVTSETIIKNSIASYGFDSESHRIDFDFRDYHYSLKREQGYFSYSRQTQKGNKKIVDIMSSDTKLNRFVNDTLFVLQDSLQKIYTNSLNSVMYFFQLPRPLEDPAVNSSLLNSVEIKGNDYWVVKITFDQEGGGDDFQDEFRYWINQTDNQIDYLAYNYLTDGGGTRFRKAINKRKINGFLFQDYSNYKPKEKFVSLDSLPDLFVKGELLELSLIENKNITVSSPK
jgi:hypothetical protein